MLLQSGLLGLKHRLLNVEPLPFGCISTEDCKLMYLKTVLEGHSCSRTPPFGHLTIHYSPQVTLMHLAANAIPLGPQIAGQKVSQLLVDIGNYLVMILLEILEQLLGLLNLHLAGLNVNICQDSVAASRRFFNILDCLRTAF
jgi:hypothetical protein